MSKMMLILIAVGGLVVGGGGAAAYFLVFSEPAPAAPEVEEFKGPPGLVTLETFLVNISDAGGERFAKLDLRLTVVPADRAVEVNEDELLQAKMRDRILTMLTGKGYEELSTPVGKEGFRREIKMVLDPLIEDGEIKEVLFQDFVVQ